MGNSFFLNDDFDLNPDSTASDDTDVWSLGEESDLGYDSIHVETVDLDMDGIDDSIIEEIDIDGDGYSDIVNIVSDTDGDGYFDTTAAAQDANYDGMIDSYTISHDSNGDGLVDYTETQIDSDFDGTVDFAVMEEDLNFDGVTDNSEMMISADDGSGDAYFMRAADLDFDGNTDKFEITREENPFSMEDEVLPDDEMIDEDTTYYPEDDDDYVVPYAPEKPEEFDDFSFDEDTEDEDIDDFNEDDDALPYIDLDELGYDESNDNGRFAYELNNFDPSTADSDSIIGNPEEVLDLWESQGDTGRCAIYAQKFVIEEYTGQEVDIEDLVDLAIENGWFTEEGGTPIIHMDKILDYYEVPNETSSGNDINDIVESLNEGHKVIVSVDADEYWFGENDDVYIPGDGVNHAVEVIGIDNSDPENPLVILNDSGNPDGRGCLVPLDTFMDAWEDGNCYMVECM